MGIAVCSAIIDIEEWPLDMGAQNTGTMIILCHFLLTSPKKYGGFQRIGRIGGAEGSGAHTGQMFGQMGSAAGSQYIFAEAAMNMQVNKAGCQNSPLCIDGIRCIALVV